MNRAISLLAVAALASPSWGCSDSAECVAVTTECAPLYEPTFDNVFRNTLLPSCGAAGSQCHAAEGAKGGLVFADIDASYAQLTGQDGSAPRVDVMAAGCSELLGRVAATDPARLMPPNARLSDSEICAITQWIAGGAQR